MIWRSCNEIDKFLTRVFKFVRTRQQRSKGSRALHQLARDDVTVKKIRQIETDCVPDQIGSKIHSSISFNFIFIKFNQ